MNSTYINVPVMLVPKAMSFGDKAEAIEAAMAAEYDTAEQAPSRHSGLVASLWNATANLKWWPAVAERKLTRAEEAEEVRALARSVTDADPGFASDLFAAAARHESKE